jgi:hypothetical protein
VASRPYALGVHFIGHDGAGFGGLLCHIVHPKCRTCQYGPVHHCIYLWTRNGNLVYAHNVHYLWDYKPVGRFLPLNLVYTGNRMDVCSYGWRNHWPQGRRASTDLFSPRELGVVGIGVTIVFDMVTTVGYSLTFSVLFVIALIGLLPFMILHVTSNAILFASALPRLNKSVRETLFSAIAGDSNAQLLPEGEE